jgi:hypothetical protein
MSAKRRKKFLSSERERENLIDSMLAAKEPKIDYETTHLTSLSSPSLSPLHQ